jgi:hypothetical protein
MKNVGCWRSGRVLLCLLGAGLWMQAVVVAQQDEVPVIKSRRLDRPAPKPESSRAPQAPLSWRGHSGLLQRTW